MTAAGGQIIAAEMSRSAVRGTPQRTDMGAIAARQQQLLLP